MEWEEESGGEAAGQQASGQGAGQGVWGGGVVRVEGES